MTYCKYYHQEKGISHYKTFAPAAKIACIRLLLGFAPFKDVNQMDVKFAFLNGYLSKLYVEEPYGFEDLGKPNLVNKLFKLLYGLNAR